MIAFYHFLVTILNRKSSMRRTVRFAIYVDMEAPIGHVVIDTSSMTTNQGSNKALISGGRVDGKFLYYDLAGIVDSFNHVGIGTTFKKLSGGKFESDHCSSPPLAEQPRIVGIVLRP